jgi:hypothetical protein
MTDTEMERPLVIQWFTALLLLIVTVSLTAIVLLVFNCFQSLLALFGGTILFLAILIACRITITWKSAPFSPALVLVLLVAALFRAEPYLWLFGGQDQGLYVNMSAHYERAGSTFINDHVRELLGAEGQKEFDETQYFFQKIPATSTELAVPYPHKYNQEIGTNYYAMTLPGIYYKDATTSQYVFQFYPLHPLWMSMAGKILGEGKRVYSPVFFSLLSIVLFYLLAYDLSGGKLFPALAVSLFLALNPLHAFFAKFPVSEEVSLFFSAAAFYALLQSYRSTQRKARIFYLWLSAGLFGGLFFTHIANFLFVPWLYFLLLVTLLFAEREKRNQFALFALGAIAFFMLSVLYALHYSYPYFMETYEQGFRPLLGIDWALWLKVAGAASIVPLVIAVSVKRRVEYDRQKLLRLMSYALMILGGAAIAIAVWRAYQLGFTTRYTVNRLLFYDFKIAASGWNSLRHSYFIGYVAFLSPIAFICLILALIRKKMREEFTYALLMLFLVQVLYLRTVIVFVNLYSYYYARYLLSELLPYSLLIVGLYLGSLYDHRKGIRYRVALLALIAIASYYFYFSSYQFRGVEVEEAGKALTRIADQLDRSSLILHDFTDSAIITPLRYYFGNSTYYSRKIETIDKALFDKFAENYGSIYLLSNRKYANQYLQLKDIIGYRYGYYEHMCIIPTRFLHESKTLYLYRLSLSARLQLYKEIIPAAVTCENFHEDGIWTNGEGIMKGFAYQRQAEDSHLILVSKGWRPIHSFQMQTVPEVFANGRKLMYVGRRMQEYKYELGKELSSIEEIRIVSPVFVPKQMGINEDIRSLGFDVDSIRIE